MLPFVLTGCGDAQPVADDGHGQLTSPACRSGTAAAVPVARADLDGDGVPEQIDYVPASGHCGALLSATVAGHDGSVALDDDLVVQARASFAISIPGRDGEVAVLQQQHPRGGFQVLMLAWTAGAGLSTLEVDDHPVFPFVATDTESMPLSAHCVRDGFVIARGRRHTPVGVVPAWDVDQTRYTVNGDTTTAGGTEESADNVLEKDFRTRYRDLVRHSLFANCRVDR